MDVMVAVSERIAQLQEALGLGGILLLEYMITFGRQWETWLACRLLKTWLASFWTVTGCGYSFSQIKINWFGRKPLSCLGLLKLTYYGIWACRWHMSRIGIVNVTSQLHAESYINEKLEYTLSLNYHLKTVFHFSWALAIDIINILFSTTGMTLMKNEWKEYRESNWLRSTW